MHPLMVTTALLAAQPAAGALAFHAREGAAACFLPAGEGKLPALVSLRGRAAGSLRPARLHGRQNSSWDPRSPDDFAKKYDEIFAPSNNRNAASHLWAEYVLSRAGGLSHGQIEKTFSWFCPVSGSPLPEPSAQDRYRSTLRTLAGGSQTGFTHHCCWPCICDTNDLIKVDTKTIKDKTGKSRRYNFTVIGNPCRHSPKRCAKEGERGCIPFEAPAVQCEGGQLKKAVLSDNGGVIIGMFFPEAAAEPEHFVDFETQRDAAGNSLKAACEKRRGAGYDSGMGAIFQQVARLNPL